MAFSPGADLDGTPRTGLDARTFVALVALAVFVTATTIAGFLISLPIGLYSLAGSCLIAAVLFGWGD